MNNGHSFGKILVLPVNTIISGTTLKSSCPTIFNMTLLLLLNKPTIVSPIFLTDKDIHKVLVTENNNSKNLGGNAFYEYESKFYFVLLTIYLSVTVTTFHAKLSFNWEKEYFFILVSATQYHKIVNFSKFCPGIVV